MLRGWRIGGQGSQWISWGLLAIERQECRRDTALHRMHGDLVLAPRIGAATIKSTGAAGCFFGFQQPRLVGGHRDCCRIGGTFLALDTLLSRLRLSPPLSCPSPVLATLSLRRLRLRRLRLRRLR